MDLKKLFNTQAKLDEHIMQEHPELRGENNLDWKLLALQVELGECANEWRGFKKWSKNQQPLTRILTTEGATNKNAVEYKCGDDECDFSFDANDGRLKDLWGDISDDCPICENGQLYALRLKNPLLEEYVDCLGFILTIGLELVIDPTLNWDDITTDESDITRKFLDITSRILEVDQWENTDSWEELFEEFYLLGKLLGFTWEQVEEAYYAKNKVNHKRQESGY
jgi:dimeric dUTPase (all-alpha-NTP-PPase superfamily)